MVGVLKLEWIAFQTKYFFYNERIKTEGIENKETELTVEFFRFKYPILTGKMSGMGVTCYLKCTAVDTGAVFF